MAEVELKREDGIAYRETTADGEAERTPVLLVHGFPETSYMWRDVMPAIGASGRRAVALDLPGFGDSEPDLPGTWERQVEAVERFRAALGLERVALVVHDWGGLIGLRWACEHPEAIEALAISDTGFFPDGKWNGIAETLRSEQGEEVASNLSRDLLAGALRGLGRGFDDDVVDEYAKVLATPERRQVALDLYRSGDFEKIEPYEETLRAFEVPVLALWGEGDELAPVAGAHRVKRELPQTEIVVVEGAGHFVYGDEPERCARELVAFLGRLGK